MSYAEWIIEIIDQEKQSVTATLEHFCDFCQETAHQKAFLLGKKAAYEELLNTIVSCESYY